MARRPKAGGMHYQYRRPNKPGGTYYVEFRTKDGERIRRSLETTKLKQAKERRDAIFDGEVVLWMQGK